MHYEKLNMLVKLGREFGRARIRHSGLSETEHAICAFLCINDQVSQTAISDALMLDKATVAKSLYLMDLKGFVIRQQNDQNRRENLIYLTNAGRACVSPSSGVHDRWLAFVLACLTDSEKKQFNAYVDRLLTQALRFRPEKTNYGGNGNDFE